MKKQTAIEWLEENLIFEPWDEEHFKHNIKCWDKAKEMEKEQMKHAYHDDRPSLSYFESGKAFEEYYKEKYETQTN